MAWSFRVSLLQITKRAKRDWLKNSRSFVMREGEKRYNIRLQSLACFRAFSLSLPPLFLFFYLDRLLEQVSEPLLINAAKLKCQWLSVTMEISLNSTNGPLFTPTVCKIIDNDNMFVVPYDIWKRQCKWTMKYSSKRSPKATQPRVWFVALERWPGFFFVAMGFQFHNLRMKDGCRIGKTKWCGHLKGEY